MDTKALVNLAEVYGAHRGLKLSTVSTYAAEDGKFFGGLKAGTAGCTLRRAANVVCWFSDNWPVDLEWPADIARPPQTKRAA